MWCMCNKMYKYIFIVIAIMSFQRLVEANITVCIPRDNDNGNSTEETYKQLVKSVKQELFILLEDNNSTISFPHLEFDFHHPALSMKGEINNVSIAQMDQFDLDFFTRIDIIRNEIELFKLTIKNMSTVGEYNMTGNIGDLFDIWGAGHFWVNALNFTITAASKMPNINKTDICLYLDIKVAMAKEDSWFSGLMDDEELEEVINHSFAGLAPEAVQILWDEFKEVIDPVLEQWVNTIIRGNSSTTISHTIRKIQENNLVWNS